jgi:hypothetical protein
LVQASREGNQYQSLGCTRGHQGDGYGEGKGNRGGGDKENGGMTGVEENGGAQYCLARRGNHLTNGKRKNCCMAVRCQEWMADVDAMHVQIIGLNDL